MNVINFLKITSRGLVAVSFIENRYTKHTSSTMTAILGVITYFPTTHYLAGNIIPHGLILIFLTSKL